MTINIPYKIRAGLYILITLGTPVVAYLLAKDVIGTLEVGLWGGLTSAVTAMAALNTAPSKEEDI